MSLQSEQDRTGLTFMVWKEEIELPEHRTEAIKDQCQSLLYGYKKLAEVISAKGCHTSYEVVVCAFSFLN